MSALNTIHQASTSLEVIAGGIGHQVVSRGRAGGLVFVALFCWGGSFALETYGDRTITFSAINSIVSSFGRLYSGKVPRQHNDYAEFEAVAQEIQANVQGGGAGEYRRYDDIDYNQALAAAQNLIKGAVKIMPVVLVTLSFYASISMGGAFYAIPVAVFCLDPQMACEAGSLLMLAYAGRQLWQNHIYSRKVFEEIKAVVKPGMDKETKRALLAPYVPNIEKNAQISLYFGKQLFGSLVLMPIGFVAGYALRRISSFCGPLEQVQTLVWKHTTERFSDALASRYAPALAGVFGYTPREA